MVTTYPRINNQNDMIDNAIRTVRETEDKGLEIERELARNREKINASREKASIRCALIFWLRSDMTCFGVGDNAIPRDAHILLRTILHCIVGYLGLYAFSLVI